MKKIEATVTQRLPLGPLLYFVHVDDVSKSTNICPLQMISHYLSLFLFHSKSDNHFEMRMWNKINYMKVANIGGNCNEI